MAVPALASTQPRRAPAPRRAPGRRPARHPRRAPQPSAPARRRQLQRQMRQHPIRFAGAGAADAAALLPQAAARTAGAVNDISNSSLIVRLTRGRGWIAVLGVLLTGIVALNVIILSLNAGAGVAGEKVDALERKNSALRAELAERLSAGRVEAEATALGMYVPDAEEVTYLRAGKGDAERAAAELKP